MPPPVIPRGLLHGLRPLHERVPRRSSPPLRGNSAASTGPRPGGLLRPRDGGGGSARDGGEDGGEGEGVGDGGEAGDAGVDFGHGAEVGDREDEQSQIVGACSPDIFSSALETLEGWAGGLNTRSAARNTHGT